MIFVIGGFQLGVHSPTRDGVPGSGFFPVVIGAAVALLGAGLIVQSLTFKGEKKESFRMEGEQRGNIRPLILTALCLVGMFVVWHIVNFEAAAVLLSLALNWVYGRSRRFSILFTIVFIGLVYLMFDRIFYIQFTL